MKQTFIIQLETEDDDERMTYQTGSLEHAIFNMILESAGEDVLQDYKLKVIEL